LLLSDFAARFNEEDGTGKNQKLLKSIRKKNGSWDSSRWGVGVWGTPDGRLFGTRGRSGVDFRPEISEPERRSRNTGGGVRSIKDCGNGSHPTHSGRGGGIGGRRYREKRRAKRPGCELTRSTTRRLLSPIPQDSTPLPRGVFKGGKLRGLTPDVLAVRWKSRGLQTQRTGRKSQRAVRKSPRGRQGFNSRKKEKEGFGIRSCNNQRKK